MVVIKVCRKRPIWRTTCHKNNAFRSETECRRPFSPISATNISALPYASSTSSSFLPVAYAFLLSFLHLVSAFAWLSCCISALSIRLTHRSQFVITLLSECQNRLSTRALRPLPPPTKYTRNSQLQRQRAQSAQNRVVTLVASVERCISPRSAQLPHSTACSLCPPQKCDEQPDPDGNCQTCVRLRLECLGFGAKRPDWMRVSPCSAIAIISLINYHQEGNSVGELRDRIKTFLASQGMIKGHSGGVASSRHSDADHPVLTLSTDTASHIGSSPPPRLGSHSPSGGGNGFPPSYERDHRDPHGHAHPRFVVGDGEDDVVRHDLLHSHSHPRLHHRTYMFTPPASDAPLFDISDGYEYCSTASASSAYRASSASAHFTPQQLSPDSPTHRMISTDVMLPQYPNPLMNNVLLSTNMSPSPCKTPEYSM